MFLRHVNSLLNVHVYQKVWFYRRKHGWRQGVVSKINRPTVHVTYENRDYPTHELRVRPYFGEFSVPPEIRENEDEIILPERLDNEMDSNDPQSSVQYVPSGKYMVTINTQNPNIDTKKNILRTDDGIIVLRISDKPTGIIDSEQVDFIPHDYFASITDMPAIQNVLTTSEKVRDISGQPKESQQKFKEAQRGEIDFLLSDCVEPVHIDNVRDGMELQKLKWVLAIKRSPNTNPPIRHRARLVSSSNLSEYRFALNGTAPTVTLSTIRTLMALVPTWDKLKEDNIQLIFRDISKAYLQSMNTYALFTINHLQNTTNSIQK